MSDRPEEPDRESSPNRGHQRLTFLGSQPPSGPPRNANVPAMRVNAVHELPNDEQLQASGLFLEREHPTEGRYIEVGMPVRFSAAPDRREHRHAAQPGHHSEEVARELGLNWPLED